MVNLMKNIKNPPDIYMHKSASYMMHFKSNLVKAPSKNSKKYPIKEKEKEKRKGN
jgi:hypothetical protein